MQWVIQMTFCSIEVGRLANGACGPVTTNIFGKSDTQTPMISKITQGDLACGKGPVVSYAPAVQLNLNKLIIETAEKNNIPFQRQASSRSTGTDTDAFAYSNDGVVSALISLPLRYMHTTVEMIHKEDVENVIQLIYESLLVIKNGQDFKYLK